MITRPASSEIKAGFSEKVVVASLDSKRRRQANIQFVRFAISAVDGCVVPQRVSCFYSLNQRAEDGIQVGHVCHVEDLSARLVHYSANIDESWNHARKEASLRRVVAGNFQVIQSSVRGDRFGHDIASPLPARVRANI